MTEGEKPDRNLEESETLIVGIDSISKYVAKAVSKNYKNALEFAKTLVMVEALISPRNVGLPINVVGLSREKIIWDGINEGPLQRNN